MYYCSIQVYTVGRRVKSKNLLQHLGLGDQSDTQAQISPQEASLQLKVDFGLFPMWRVHFLCRPLKLLEATFVSTRITKVKAWNEKPTNKGGQLHDSFLTISPSATLGTTVLRKYLQTENYVYAPKYSITFSLKGHSHIQITKIFFSFWLINIGNVKWVQF